MKNPTGKQAPRTRWRLGQNQHDFWSRIGVTQSGGSRYESGRRIPRPVQILLTLRCGTPRQARLLVDRIRRDA